MERAHIMGTKHFQIPFLAEMTIVLNEIYPRWERFDFYARYIFVWDIGSFAS